MDCGGPTYHYLCFSSSYLVSSLIIVDLQCFFIFFVAAVKGHLTPMSKRLCLPWNKVTIPWIMPLKMEIGNKWQHRPLLLLRWICNLSVYGVNVVVVWPIERDRRARDLAVRLCVRGRWS